MYIVKTRNLTGTVPHSEFGCHQHVPALLWVHIPFYKYDILSQGEIKSNHHIPGPEWFHPYRETPLGHPIIITHSLQPQPLATTNLSFITVILSCQKYCVNGIIQHVTFFTHHNALEIHRSCCGCISVLFVAE